MRLLISLGLASLGIACSCKGPGARAPAPIEDSPGLTLLDPGREPRRQLRFTVKPDERRTVVYRMGGTFPDGGVTPGFTLRMALAVTAVTPDGTFTTTTQVVSAIPSDEASRQIFSSFIEGLKGPTTTEVRNDRGVLLETRVEPADKPPFGAGGWMLPSTAVGPGARWRVHDLAQRGPPERDDPEYELVAIDGDRVTVRVTQHAPTWDARGELVDDLGTLGIERYVTVNDERSPITRTSRIVIETE